MLILSQDKRTLVNLDKIKTIELDNQTNFKSIIIFRETNEVKTGVCGVCIGHYATEGRARHVLQKIMKAYLECNEQTTSTGVGYVANGVYIMPED